MNKEQASKRQSQRKIQNTAFRTFAGKGYGMETVWKRCRQWYGHDTVLVLGISDILYEHNTPRYSKYFMIHRIYLDGGLWVRLQEARAEIGSTVHSSAVLAALAPLTSDSVLISDKGRGCGGDRR